MLKKLLILSVLSFSVFAQANQSLIEMVEKKASAQEIQEAIQQGADVNERGKKGQTVLMRAIGGHDADDDFFPANIQVVSVLLQYGADVNAIKSGGDKDESALVNASFSGRADIVKLLLQYGANVNMTVDEDFNITALMAASLVAQSEVVKALLEAGANVNARDEDGNTALAYVHTKTILFIIPVNKADYEGTVQALLQAGATQ